MAIGIYNSILRRPKINTGFGNVSKVSAGTNFAIILCTDGSLWGIGVCSTGELGIGSIGFNPKLKPIRIGTSNDWIDIVCGLSHTLAIKSNGTLWAWGRNTSAQCGQPVSTSVIYNPTQIGVETTWVKLAESLNGPFSLAIKSDNTMWFWGNNASGASWGSTPIGSNTPTPSKITYGSNIWLQCTGGSNYLIAVTPSGFIYSGGANRYGQLGLADGFNINSSDILGYHGTTNKLTGQIIHAGWFDTFKISYNSNQSISFGYGSQGGRGDGSVTSAKYTDSIVINGTDLIKIAGNNTTFYSLNNTGHIYVWYSHYTNASTYTNISTPLDMGITDSNWVDICAGSTDTLYLLKNDGTLWTMGLNQYGQAGINSIVYVSTPTRVTGN